MTTNGHSVDLALIDAELAAIETKRKELRRMRRLLGKPRRPYCQQPANCVAGARGGCGLCHGARMSAARKAAWADPAVRARMSAARKAAWADPAVRAARKAAWIESDRALPTLTTEQKKVYTKLRPIVGREAALAEATR